MKVSVAMAIYNGEEYILSQLKSILSQSHYVDEVVCYDDCSKDNSGNIVKSFIESNNLSSNWKYYKQNKNKGYAGNFYDAMCAASGDIIFLCDQDDVWKPDRIEKMLNVMKQNSKIMVLGTDYDPFSCTEDAPILSSRLLKRMKYDNSIEMKAMNKKNIFIGCEGCAMCIRKTFFDTIKQYWVENWAHDEYIWKLSQCVDGCYIYHYSSLDRRLHSNNVSKRKLRTVKDRVAFLKRLLNGHYATLKYLTDNHCSNSKINLVKKHIKSVELRINLLEKNKVLNIIRLLPYLSYYEYKKSFLVEAKIVIL